jgi:hypothetical protein
MAKTRTNKLFLAVQDERFKERRQFSVLNLLTNGDDIYLNQYGKIFTEDEIGYFDVTKDPDLPKALLEFHPIDNRINEYNYHYLSYDTKADISKIGNYSFGDLVSVATSHIGISYTSVGTISQIPADHTSAKILVEVSSDDGVYEYKEISLINSDSGILTNEYGNLAIGQSGLETSGLGTFFIYNAGSTINLDFYPNDKDVTSNTIAVSIANTTYNVAGSRTLKYANLASSKTSIAATVSPFEVSVAKYTSNFEASYFLAQVTDLTNDQIYFSEIAVLNNLANSYIIEYGVLSTSGNLGNFTTNVSDITELFFTPNPDIDVEVAIFQNDLTLVETPRSPFGINLNNSEITTGVRKLGYGDENNYRINFNLLHKKIPIFERVFNGTDPFIVNTSQDYVYLPNHFFVTGEKVKYRSLEYDPDNTENSIGIAYTTITGVGYTNKLSGELYIYKLDETRIKFAISAENALLEKPKLIDITSVGIGDTHAITATNQNSKCLITIDNVIQSPLVSTAVTASLVTDLQLIDTTVIFSGITSFFSGDLIKIDDEIMKIDSVGVGSDTYVEVKRPWIGTDISEHSSGAVITKMNGNYNIVNNTIYFSEAPYGPIRKPSYLGTNSIIPEYEVKSEFQGRAFIRSGIPNSTLGTYENNYIFDDISSKFNAVNKSFELKNSTNSITGIATDNAVILINSIFQGPTIDYNLNENLGKSELIFTGAATSVAYDVNNATVPRGGIIVSLGSSYGYGYQPLVSAGGTAIVSSAGTVQSISIGNSGSGYRVGLQTYIKVGVQTYSSNTPNIEFIGTATVSNGSIIAVTITNPGSGYTSSNPPMVVFDEPLSYSNIPLIYDNRYPSGVGSQAVIDIVVGQGSSVIDFTIKNYGYSYENGEVLTIQSGGISGIPTDTTKTFEPFSIKIERIHDDSFSGWTLGNLQVLDDISYYFNGKSKVFPLLYNNERFSIIAKKGSNIDIKATLLVFINDVLQVPDKAYIFNGGSTITFTEAPKKGDTVKIIFYRGTDGIDVIDVDILETVKIGDIVKLNSDDFRYKENNRLVSDILTPDTIKTIPYKGPGVSDDPELLRPIYWTKQREDLVIDDQIITKDRVEYESELFPLCSIIQSVGIGTTMIFVDSIKGIFDDNRENSGIEKYSIQIIDQSELRRASAQSIVSSAGILTSIQIIDGGIGYTFNPEISISSPVGVGTTIKSTALSYVTSGIVTSIELTYGASDYDVNNPPAVLIETPIGKIEKINDVKYEGDYGIISGIQTGNVGFASTALIFDLLIPEDSILRNSKIIETPITTSEIKNNYYLKVYDSVVGNGVTSLRSDGSIIGIGTTGINNIYKVISVSIASTDAYGIGVTNVAKITVSVSNYNGLSGIGYSNYYGKYTWGLITTKGGNLNEFSVNQNYGIVGLNSTPYIRRFSPLRYIGYDL